MQGTDVLFPQIGEIIGGSVREESYDKLMAEIERREMDKTHLWWYIDTRRWGTCPHAGFGLGFERLILFVTGMQNTEISRVLNRKASPIGETFFILLT